MPSRPSQYLNWNPTQSNVLQPSSGLQTSGNLPGQTLAAQYYNWFANLTDQWIQYLDSVTNLTQISVTTTTALTASVRTCLADPTSASFNVSLPNSVSGTKGNRYTIVNSSYVTSNTITVLPFFGSGNTLAGQSSVTLGAGEYITFEDNGAGAFFQVG